MEKENILLDEIQSLGQFYDQKANKMKKIFLYFWYSGIFSGVIAVGVFATITLYKNDVSKVLGGLILPIVEVVLIGISFITLSKIAPRLKKRFIDARRSAEILRVHELFCVNNIALIPSSFKLEEYTIPKAILEIEEKSKVQEIPTNKSQDNKETLISLKTFIEGQNKYHNKDRIEKFEKREHLLEFSLQVILWLFLSIIFFKLVIELLNYYGEKNLFNFKLKGFLYAFKFTIICLPPLYAALEGFYYFSEWKRNIKESELVSSKFTNLTNLIDASLDEENHSNEQLETVSEKLYQLFHEENQNWYRWYSSKKIEARI